MTLPQCETLMLYEEKGVVYITLNRPQVRNAMSLTMVEELMNVFSSVRDNRDVRIMVLRGAGGHFCAGGDIQDMAMARQRAFQGEANAFMEINRKFGRLITLVNSAPQAVVAVLEGAVMGGGFGLACVSDIAIAKKDAVFKLPETSLGLPPAQIAPFVVQRVGLTQARRMAVMGAKFNGEEAKQLGVVHTVCETEEELAQEFQAVIKQIRRCAPNANAITKKLMMAVGQTELEQLLDEAAQDFSDCVQGPEGAEGTQAFISKRLPSWAEE
ncbi:MAG: enoyl-CoA hydratase/isomerase family protein [SAR324 cluster bacterium]|nr:enoyl-CoA hydratase/isomerase family protein [SAR324 cluster bacterium]